MEILKTPKDVQIWRINNAKNVGFVATMGALHAGHLKLIGDSKNTCDVTIASIFVNPTQFNSSEDLEKYPRTIDADLEKLQKYGVDAVFLPEKSDLYPDNYAYKVHENSLSKLMEGEHRNGHFDGVLSVVMKLFNIIRPNKAFFGEKDFQQLALIKGMVDAFFMDIEVIGVETVREENGLALSSRNVLLSDAEKEKSYLFFKYLTECSSANDAAKKLRDDGFEVDYVTDFNGRRFGAIKVGNVRLIDNIKTNDFK